MINSQTLAKIIVEQFIRKLPPDNVESTITSMLENFRLTEINKYVNNKNVENAFKANEKAALPRIQDPNIKRVQVWSR